MANVFLVALVVNSFGYLLVHCFNLDFKEPIVMTSGFSGEYFGFSVALHSYGSEKWVLVGAPLANHTAPPGSRYKIHERYGAVYKCPPKKGSSCQIIPIDDSDPNYIIHEHKYWDTDFKTGQWLGATLHSNGHNGKVVACAPRYAFRGTTVDPYRYKLLGRCYLVWGSLTGTYQQIDPCYHGEDSFNMMYGRRHDGFCQAGFAASVFQNGETLALSAVGFDYNKGTVGVYFQDSKETLFAERNELKMDERGDLMGYAVTTGNFMSSSSEQIIGSSPRAGNLKGRVMAFDVVGRDKIKVSFTLPLPKDSQMGSSFGHAICAVDLNQDGMSDLLVAAPMHNIEEGRVYVYVNNGLGALNLMDNMVLNGEQQPMAKFGFSIASVGDLNKDGYNDVAIGAPYGGEDGRGVVYIYHGNSQGISTKYRQKITAAMMGDSKLKTFGYSLTGGIDMDNNKYPDIAVGAYSSDRTVLLRTRPIVEVEAKIELSQNEILLEDNKTSVCDFADGTRHKCLTAKVCFKYAFQVASNQGIKLSYSLTLDQDMQSDLFRRMFFLGGRNISQKAFMYSSNIALTEQNQWKCDPEYKVFLREKHRIGDLLSPLTFDVHYDLLTSSPCVVCPILRDYDNERSRSVRVTGQFLKHCGPDRKCVPDMTIEGNVLFSGGYKDLRIGVSNELNVSITVGNKAEDFAYPGQVIVTYPSLLGYIGTETEGIQCTRAIVDDETKDKEEAVCMVGLPFHGKSKKHFFLKFTTSEIKGNIRQLEIDLRATSPSRDADPSDNKVKLLVNVKFEADLSITGSSLPDEVVYDDTTSVSFQNTRSEKDIGPVITQNIIVRNDGPSAVDGSVVEINIPWKLQKDVQHSYLLYLLDVRVLGIVGSCNAITNPLNIKVANSTNMRSGHIDKIKSFTGQKKEKADIKSGSICNHAECRTFRCRLGRLQQGDDVQIIMTSRLWQNTLVKADAGSIDLVTSAKVTPPSSITEPVKDKSNEVEILVRANPKETKPTSEETPIWIIILSVIAGLILLALVIFILYKCGFFKRNRAKDLANDEERTSSDTRYDVASQEDRGPRARRT